MKKELIIETEQRVEFPLRLSLNGNPEQYTCLPEIHLSTEFYGKKVKVTIEEVVEEKKRSIEEGRKESEQLRNELKRFME